MPDNILSLKLDEYRVEMNSAGEATIILDGTEGEMVFVICEGEDLMHLSLALALAATE